VDRPLDPAASSSAGAGPTRVRFPPTWHGVIFAAVIIGLATLVVITQEALAPYIVGLIIVFLLNGTVDRLARAGLPRWAGTLIAIIALIAGVVLFFWIVLDALLAQAAALVGTLPEIAAAVSDWLLSLNLPPGIYEMLRSWVVGFLESLPQLIGGAFGFVLEGAAGLAAFIVAIAGLPFWIFYALSDSPALLAGFREAVPGTFRSGVLHILGILGRVFGAWARGMAIIAVIVGIPFFIAFNLFGIWIDPDIADYALLFSVTLAISELIPIIGPILALIPILLITAVIAGLPGVVAVLIVFVVIEQIDGAVIQPQVQSHALDLHPAIILPALVVGSALAGLLGAILALPVTAAGRQIVAYLLGITSGDADPASVVAAEPGEPGPPEPATA
jgi:predicted PurR-regulated permease PerM